MPNSESTPITVQIGTQQLDLSRISLRVSTDISQFRELWAFVVVIQIILNQKWEESIQPREQGIQAPSPQLIKVGRFGSSPSVEFASEHVFSLSPV